MTQGDIHLTTRPEFHRWAILKGYSMRQVWEAGYKVLSSVDENSIESIEKRKEECIFKMHELENEIRFLEEMKQEAIKKQAELKELEKDRVVQVI